MFNMTSFSRSLLLRGALVAMSLGTLSACGGGGGEVSVSGGAYVAPLALSLTRVGPQAIEIDWSDDSYVAQFLVVRDGRVLTSVNANSLVDASVFVDQTYCSQVEGYDGRGVLVAISSTGCITVVR